jgi:4'-phosphopantetheinyl transferase
VTTPSGWSRAPESPTLEPGDAAVWRLPPGTSRPIETVLAKYLGSRPASVTLTRTPTGKPELEQSRLCVSLTHSSEVALVAVALDSEVGVDVELLREGTETWSLVSHALTVGEQTRLQALPVSLRGEAFLSTWARKEALLKAVGVGLAVDPRLIELDGSRVVTVPPELGEAGDWTLIDLPVPGHTSALALRGRLARLLLHDAPRAEPAG